MTRHDCLTQCPNRPAATGRRALMLTGLAALLIWFTGCSAPHTGTRTAEAFWSNVRPISGELARLERNARFLRLAGRPQLALKELEEAHRQSPDDLRIIDLLAQCYEDLGEWQRAEELYLEALARHEGNSALANNLCFSYFLAGNYGEAEACFRKALKRHPGNEKLLNNLGLVLTRMGRQEEALALWRRAAGEEIARQRLSQALAALGLKEVAGVQQARPEQQKPPARLNAAAPPAPEKTVAASPAWRSDQKKPRPASA
ncbi:MAG: tetratricopeptide repeat protein, partial [Deltaproteobacteria bacterium]|nr:tetratricopeptide repeat protein [Deltaproteobacteria bacterium]